MPVESIRPSSSATEISVISLGRPSITERRERALQDLRRTGLYIRGDVEVVVTQAVRSARYISHVIADLDEVRAILRAYVIAEAIDSFEAIKSLSMARPYVDGFDCIYVAVRPVVDSRLMLA